MQRAVAEMTAARRQYQEAVEDNGRLEARIEAFTFSSQAEQSQLNSEVRRREDMIQRLRTQQATLQDTISRQQQQVITLLIIITWYFIIIISIMKGIYRAQDRPKATSALCLQRNCQLFTCQPSTYYQQLKTEMSSVVF